MLEECSFEEAEYAIFETDRYDMINIGEIYEIPRNEVTKEFYVWDREGRDNYGVFMTDVATYYRFTENIT